jgi:glycosyltransferase involved in cell wall biosynthesis
MRLTHINSYFFSNRLHLALVEKLSDAVQGQHVFIPLPKSEKAESPSVANVTFSVLSCFSKLERLLWPLKMWRIWRNYCRDREPYCADLNHAHTLFVNGLIAYWAKKKFGTPYVVTIRNTDVNQFLKKYPAIFRPIGLKIMCEAEAVLTLSHVYWDKNIRCYYKGGQIAHLDVKHKTIPNGCEDFWFEYQASRSVLDGPLRLVFVGLLGENKNLRSVLAACRLLQVRGIDFNLKVVGSGPLEAEFRKAAIDLPVHFLGYVSDRAGLLEVYRDSDLLVVPSFTESFGVVYAEAMSQGLPVIYTSGQGFDGFFSDGTVGFAVDPYNPVQIADRIVAIMNDYQSFAANVAMYAETFRWENAVNSLTQVYGLAPSSVVL